MLFRSVKGVAASVAVLFFAELGTFVALSSYVNPIVLILVTIGLSVFGTRLLFRDVPGRVARSMQDLVGADRDVEAEQSLGRGAVRVVAALLLLFPGLLSGVVGMLILVGPVQRLVASSLGSRLAGLLPAGALHGHSFGRRRDIVDVTSTVKDPARPRASSAPPELR